MSRLIGSKRIGWNKDDNHYHIKGVRGLDGKQDTELVQYLECLDKIR